MSRVQLALNVTDVDAAVDFYTKLFATPVNKRKPGYANFEIAEPPLKLVLIETTDEVRGVGVTGALNHLGVEVESGDEVGAARDRFAQAGLASFDENDTTCCYALQDKVWVHDPSGAPWEVYVVKDDNPVDGRPATASLPLLEAKAEAGFEGAGCCTSTPSVACCQ